MGYGRKPQTAFSHHTSIAYYFKVNVFLNNILMGPVDHYQGLISPLEFPISKCFSHIKYLCFRLFPLGVLLMFLSINFFLLLLFWVIQGIF